MKEEERKSWLKTCANFFLHFASTKIGFSLLTRFCLKRGLLQVDQMFLHRNDFMHISVDLKLDPLMSEMLSSTQISRFGQQMTLSIITCNLNGIASDSNIDTMPHDDKAKHLSLQLVGRLCQCPFGLELFIYFFHAHKKLAVQIKTKKKKDSKSFCVPPSLTVRLQ